MPLKVRIGTLGCISMVCIQKKTKTLRGCLIKWHTPYSHQFGTPLDWRVQGPGFISSTIPGNYMIAILTDPRESQQNTTHPGKSG